jgi:hypothetical protein
MLTTNLPGGLVRYEWDSYQVPALPSGNHEPGWYNAFQRVQVSDFNSWAEVVAWAMKINPLTNSFKGELAQTIAKLKKEAGADKEKYFRSAVKLVQDEVRYMGIETGEYSHRANDSDKVYKQRYGDCKDKALLLASILQADDIEAHMVLISTGLKDKLDDFLPSSALFNHAVAVATINGKDVWVDATIAYQRGTGTNLYFPSYLRGLMLKQGTTALSIIPETPHGKTIINETYTVPNEKDSADLKIVTKYTLNEADEQRGRLASSSISETENNYLNYYSKIYPAIEVKDSLNIIDDEQKNELTTIEHYRIGSYLKLDSTDGKYHGRFYANTINEQLPKLNSKTHNPVGVNYPCDIDYTVKFILPDAWNMEESSDKIVRDSYEFFFDRNLNGDTLTQRYRFTYDKDFVAANQVPQFIQDVSDLSDHKLSFWFYYTPSGSLNIAKSNTNMWMVLYAFTILFGSTYGAVKFYQAHTYSQRIRGFLYGRILGGWLILPMLGLMLTPVKMIMDLQASSYFKAATWNAMQIGWRAILYKTTLLFELGGNLIISCAAIFALVLMFKKRDILPRVMVWFYAANVGLVVIDHVLVGIYAQVADASLRQVIQACIAAAIWIPYFKVSTPVKETFIVPYPSYNILYEPDLTRQDNEPLTNPDEIIPASPKTIEGSEWDGV